MRAFRPPLLALALVAAIAAWPQDSPLPAVDHSQHPVIDVPAGEPVPAMEVRLVPDRMDGFNIVLTTQNFRFTPQDVGGPAVPNEGHAHLYVNGEKAARLYSPWHHIPAKLLREGINRLEIEFSANDHSVWGVSGDPIGADVLIDTRDSDGDPIVREEVRYTLGWDWERAKRSEGGGWEVQTDLGYLVHVTSGRLVTRNLELVPCHALPPEPPNAAWLRWIKPQPVLAGHSSMVPNESKISRSYEEDLANPGTTFIESRIVTDPEYCKAHYLIARPTGSGPGTPALEVSGTWKRTGASGETAFRIRSSAAYGQFLDLSSATGDRLVRRAIVGGINMTLQRSLGSMFDGFDFKSAPPGASDSRLVRRLVAGTVALVEDG